MRRLLLALPFLLATACGPAGADEDVASAAGAIATRADQVTVCHATSSKTNPYVAITIDAAGLAGHVPHHEGDFVSQDGRCELAPGQCRTNADCVYGQCAGGWCTVE